MRNVPPSKGRNSVQRQPLALFSGGVIVGRNFTVKGLPMAEAAMLRPFEGVLEITIGRYRAELPNQPDNARYRSMAAFDLLEALDVTTLPLFQERE